MLGHLLEELFGAVEILLHEDFGVVVWAFCSFLTVPVHVVPAQFPDNVLEFTEFSLEAKAHIKVRTALVHMPVRAVLSLLTPFSHEIGTDLEIMTKVALIPVPTRAHSLELVAWFDLALVVRIGTVITEPALAMDEFLADTIGGEFVVVGRSRSEFLVGSSLVLDLEVSGVVCQLIGVWVHCLL